MRRVPEGYYKVARKIKKSEIWQSKPSWWLKVWLYIIDRVNHSQNNSFCRGSNFFNRSLIWTDCCLLNDGVKSESVDNVIRWLKSTGQITTRKTTRGFIITVCNYEFYQEEDNYRNDGSNDIKNDSKTTQERDRNDTINKNEKNGNNDEENSGKIFVDPESDWYKQLKNDFSNIDIDGEFKRFLIWEKDNSRNNHKKSFKNWLLNSEPQKQPENGDENKWRTP